MLTNLANAQPRDDDAVLQGSDAERSVFAASSNPDAETERTHADAGHDRTYSNFVDNSSSSWHAALRGLSAPAVLTSGDSALSHLQAGVGGMLTPGGLGSTFFHSTLATPHATEARSGADKAVKLSGPAVTHNTADGERGYATVRPPAVAVGGGGSNTSTPSINYLPSPSAAAFNSAAPVGANGLGSLLPNLMSVMSPAMKTSMNMVHNLDTSMNAGGAGGSGGSASAAVGATAAAVSSGLNSGASAEWHAFPISSSAFTPTFIMSATNARWRQQNDVLLPSVSLHGESAATSAVGAGSTRPAPAASGAAALSSGSAPHGSSNAHGEGQLQSIAPAAPAIDAASIFAMTDFNMFGSSGPDFVLSPMLFRLAQSLTPVMNRNAAASPAPAAAAPVPAAPEVPAVTSASAASAAVDAAAC